MATTQDHCALRPLALAATAALVLAQRHRPHRTTRNCARDSPLSIPTSDRNASRPVHRAASGDHAAVAREVAGDAEEQGVAGVERLDGLPDRHRAGLGPHRTPVGLLLGLVLVALAEAGDVMPTN
jgi:hypothetical protein